MKKYVIGVDCGTQKVKVVIVNAIGDILGKDSVAYAPPIFHTVATYLRKRW